MGAFKVGDRVLVEMRVDEVCEGWPGDRRYRLAAAYQFMQVGEFDIHGPAPAPEVDWSTVPMGARVRVRAPHDPDGRNGRFIQVENKSGRIAFQALTRFGATEWWPECELVEGGGDD